jgi:hypothetical protein
MNKERHLEKVVVVAKDWIRLLIILVKWEQFRNIQSEKEKQSTVLLDDQKETFQPPDFCSK